MPDDIRTDVQADAALPAHIESTVRSIAELHTRHHRTTTFPQRAVARITDWIGRPAALATLTLMLLAWVAANLLAARLGRQPWDPPPFAWLETAVSVLALYTTVLILTTQRHDDRLAGQREQLTLELAILSDHKSAKIIELLEKIRRDSPHLHDHDDAEATAMARPADPQSVLDALHETDAPTVKQG